MISNLPNPFLFSSVGRKLQFPWGDLFYWVVIWETKLYRFGWNFPKIIWVIRFTIAGKYDMGLGVTLGLTLESTLGCTLSHFAPKFPPGTVQNGSELLWGYLYTIFIRQLCPILHQNFPPGKVQYGSIRF